MAIFINYMRIAIFNAITHSKSKTTNRFMAKSKAHQELKDGYLEKFIPGLNVKPTPSFTSTISLCGIPYYYQNNRWGNIDR